MRHTTCSYRACSRVPYRLAGALAVCLLTLANMARGSTRPHYGGTLSVQMSDRITTLDPRQWPTDSLRAAAVEKVASLLFDRLTRLDDHANPQRALALSWQHDAPFKRWQFLLRKGVKFTDGAPLTPETAALALQQLLGNAFDVSATSDSVVIKSEISIPDFPAQLASGRYFVFHAGDDGTLAGTGPFRLAENAVADPPGKIVFLANESCWAGRPFVDKIELAMGVDLQQQASAIAFGQADVVELPASEVRRASQRGVRTVSSSPVDLFALRFDEARPGVQDARLRNAISLAIDRAAIADVILQRQGVAAGGLLPNWISGYAQLFRVSPDMPRAKELVLEAAREVSRSAPLVLIYDSGDEVAREVAERVAVNLKEAGITVQVSGQPESGKSALADIRLIRRRISEPDPGLALASLLDSLGETPASLATPEETYAAERAPVDAFRIIPLVHVSESYGLSPQVRDWMPPRWGGWRLEDVWLGPPSSGGAPQ